ncbi:hypothetical protein HNR01_001718 [Methylorubrum rhodesianum]|nr:hypothetical protein [Methylorubrum rhodesianum]
MRRLTDAQQWALLAIAEGHGSSPAALGQRMMKRPGVEERRKGGNRNSPQGLGRIGGTMMTRLRQGGLVALSSGVGRNWHATRATLTPKGRAALAPNTTGRTDRA